MPVISTPSSRYSDFEQGKPDAFSNELDKRDTTCLDSK